MKELIIKITSFFLTFFIGIVVFINWKFYNLPQIELVSELSVDLIETTVCQISDYSNDFNGKLVSFKATTYNNNDKLILLPLKCLMVGDNYFLYPTLEHKNYNRTHNNLISILQTDTPPSEMPDYTKLKEVDIKVIGIVKEFYDNEGHKLFSIIPQKIEIISSFRQFEPRGAA